MIWLKIISKFIKAFRAGESPNQIAAGFGVGFLIGIMPLWTIQSIFFIFVLILVNINLAAGTVALLLAKLFAYLLDPIFHDIGYFILTDLSFMQNTWEAIYNIPLGPLSRFNNTVVMGSFVSGIILFFPVFFGMKILVVAYRERLEERMKKWKIVQAIKGSKLFNLYVKIRDIGGE